MAPCVARISFRRRSLSIGLYKKKLAPAAKRTERALGRRFTGDFFGHGLEDLDGRSDGQRSVRSEKGSSFREVFRFRVAFRRAGFPDAHLEGCLDLKTARDTPFGCTNFHWRLLAPGRDDGAS